MYNYIMKLWLHRFPGNGLRPSFGNNLFGWLAMKVIQHQYGHIEVNHLEELNTPLEISDAVWDRYSLEFEKNQGLRIGECSHRDLHLYAFFQNSTVLLYYRDYLRSLITKENTEYITPLTEPQVVQVSDIASTVIDDAPTNNDVVIHVRLGDFKHNGGSSSEIIHPLSYWNILDKLSFERLIIVVKAPEDAFEHKYLDLFKKRYPNVVIRSSTKLVEDFVFLMKSKRIIVSNSTFCWCAAFLGDSEENYVIRNTYYKGQKLDHVNSKSILCGVQYITPEEIERISI